MMAMAQFPTNNYLIYVVDDDKAIARLLSINLEARGYQVKEFGSGLQAVSSLGTDDPHLVILDIMMPGPDGLEITRQRGGPLRGPGRQRTAPQQSLLF